MNKNGFKRYKKRFICLLLSCLVAGFAAAPAVSAEDSADESASFAVGGSDIDDGTYFSYYSANKDVERVEKALRFSCEQATAAVLDEYDGIQAAFVGEGGYAEWNVSVPADGCYALMLDYYNIPGKNNNAAFTLYIDGTMPFKELNAIELPRCWSDELDDNGDFYSDPRGNDKLPEQHEILKWQSIWIGDTQGMYTEPYEFFFTAGTHSIRFEYFDGEFSLGAITLGQPETAPSYEAYLEEYGANGSSFPAEPIIIQAEKPLYKSSSGIYAQSDSTNASVSPNRAGYTKLNFIGGSGWAYIGQSLTWSFEIKNDGWYTISLKARQNTNQGMRSTRSLLIDGEIPFAEAGNISVPYDLKWKVYTLGNGEDYKFYLRQGKHSLTLSCAAGEMAPALRDLKQTVLELNSLYREIIMVTGISPDVYQDYNLETVIEDLRPRLNKLSSDLSSISDNIASITGSHDTQASALDETAIMLEKMSKSPYTIPLRLSNYKSNVENLGSLLYTLGQQPLALDYIELTPEGSEPGDGEIGFFENLAYQVGSFIASFTQDYNSFSSTEGEKSVEAWMSSGRDQIKLVNDLINDRFTSETGISVNLSLVDTGTTLIQATLAGKGPDVAFCLPQDTPVNLASRGALLDLSEYDIDSVRDEVGAEAFIPFEYEGGLYALPDSETFYMLFYRTDIFEELGLKPPETWEDFYEVLNVLESNNLRVGVPEINAANKGVSSAITTFNILLYQRGGSLYTPDHKKTALDTETANSCFEQLVEFYTLYGLEQDYNFFNRFRSGEMAMALDYYSSYNQLSVAAPELNGLWSFAPVPGTRREDGSLERTAIGTVTGTIVMKSAEDRGVAGEAVELAKWWVSSETQTRYANMLEATMGLLARYTPANRKAFENMNWSSADAAVISEQWNQVTCIPEIPGGYYVNRSLTSALRSAITGDSPARRELSLVNRDINDEITRKRREFGLDE